MAVSATRPMLQENYEVELLTPGSERDGVRGRTVAIYNPGPETVWIGGPRVEVGTGFTLPALGSLTLDLAKDERLYGISDDVAQELHVLQVGV